MKRLTLSLLAFLVACNNHTKNNSSSITATQDSSKLNTFKTDTPNIKAVEARLNINTCFADVGNSYIYIIDKNYCFLNSKVCSYFYNADNHILSIDIEGIMSDSSNDQVYYEVESGSDIKKRGWDLGINVSKLEQNYSLNNNLNNPSFALLLMDKTSDGQYKMDLNSVGYRINIYRPLNFKEITIEYNTTLHLLKEAFDSFDRQFLLTENKVDILKNMGETDVDSKLTNKVDYTYKSMIIIWDKFNNRKNKIEIFLGAHQEINTQQLYYPRMFTELILNLIDIKQLIEEDEKYNERFDDEILPILNQGD